MKNNKLQMKVSDKVIFRLLRQLERNKKKEKPGIPISAVLLYKKGLIKFSTVNSRTINKQHDPKTHAEIKCIESLKKDDKNKYRVIVVSKTCETCLNCLEEDGRITEAVYLTDKKRGNTKLKSNKVNLVRYEPNNNTKEAFNKIMKIYEEFLKYNDGNNRPKTNQ